MVEAKELISFNKLVKKAREYLPSQKVALIEAAYKFANKAHEGQNRKSGEPYIEHPLQVAMRLTELQLDADSLAAALLHDVTENCDIPNSRIEEEFGPEVAKLVDATTKLGRLSQQASVGKAWQAGTMASAGQAENLRKMLVAMAEDIRVVFIKLADRLHNMQTLEALSREKQEVIARETMEIYAPLAHRLGIWELKWQLEDLAYRFLEPDDYHQIARRIAGQRDEREKFIAEATNKLGQEIDKAKLVAEITGRPKHIYSIHQKIEKYAAQGKDFDDIHDLLALRVLVSTVTECYTALGIIHNIWHPLPDQFDDFIANPQPNGYQSLHTVVWYQGTITLEIQIRTYEMHYIAEYGVAAHWRYKEGGQQDISYEERIGWLRQLIEWHRELSGAEEFLESVRTDVFSDQVFVYTPDGEIKDLPKGATPLDFAYRIHTDLGHRCIGAKVNGRLVPLTYKLKNGEVVQIRTGKADKGPSRDWLMAHLGYVNTSHAKGKIRQWFKKQEKADNIERGREILDKELKRLGVRLSEREELAKIFNYDSVEDFCAAVGYGGVTLHQIATKLDAKPRQEKTAVAEPPKAPESTVKVLGVGDMLTHLSKCCQPVPGDDIIGYVTRSRGVTIHRKDCANVAQEEEKERLISVQWGEKAAITYPVRVKIEAWDRLGLMKDISTLVTEEKVNIVAVDLENKDGVTYILLIIEIADLAQLSRLLAKIEGIRGVMSVSRVIE